jgi:hypothetical protein
MASCAHVRIEVSPQDQLNEPLNFLAPLSRAALVVVTLKGGNDTAGAVTKETLVTRVTPAND